MTRGRDRNDLVVLILGGYGTFGGRLATLLRSEPRLTLVIAGRSRARAERFAASLGGAARAVGAVADRADVGPALDAHRPDVVVDASGPFQDYGGEPYRVVRACLARGIGYLDLADGAGFVSGIAALDGEAAAAGTFALSGMSSFPVLTAAVADELSRGLARVDSIMGGIAPSPYAGVGPNVIRAIAGYAGRPVRLWRDGREGAAHALTESRDYTVSPPGLVPLRTTRFSLVDVPDHLVLPRRLPVVSEVWIGAGTVPEVLHRALNLLSWLVRLRVLPSIGFLAPVIDRVANLARWGEHRGGMFVLLRGRTAEGLAVERSWHLLAEGDDGPMIPSMAAEAVIRRGLAGTWPVPGARPGDGEVTLRDYERLFDGRRIHTGRRRSEDGADGVPLFRRILGEAWAALPPPVRALHGGAGARAFSGFATVRRGRNPLARLVALAVGFPPAAREVPVRVSFEADGRRETWRRTFGGRSFSSVMEEGEGRWERLLIERFGPVRAGMALVVDDGALMLVVRRWSLFGIPMPRVLGPGGSASETAEGGRFRFDVQIRLPWAGLVAGYSGWLEPEPPAAAGTHAADAAA